MPVIYPNDVDVLPPPPLQLTRAKVHLKKTKRAEPGIMQTNDTDEIKVFVHSSGSDEQAAQCEIEKYACFVLLPRRQAHIKKFIIFSIFSVFSSVRRCALFIPTHAHTHKEKENENETKSSLFYELGQSGNTELYSHFAH